MQRLSMQRMISANPMHCLPSIDDLVREHTANRQPQPYLDAIAVALQTGNHETAHALARAGYEAAQLTLNEVRKALRDA